MTRTLAAQKKRYIIRQHPKYPNNYQIIDIYTGSPIATFHGEPEGILRAKEYAEFENHRRPNSLNRIFGLLTLGVGVYILHGSFIQAWQAQSWIPLALMAAWAIMGVYLVLKTEN